MKIKSLIALSISTLALSNSLYAAKAGVYAGFGLGESRLSVDGFSVSQPDNSMYLENSVLNKAGFAGRIFAGYNFNQNFGIEAGWTKYATSKRQFFIQDFSGHDFSANEQIKLSTLDIVGKAYLPLVDSGFSVYGLGGLNYSFVKDERYELSSGKKSIMPAQTENSFKPIVGLGINYDIKNTNLSTSLEYTHVFADKVKEDWEEKNVKSPSADLISFNIAYNFG